MGGNNDDNDDVCDLLETWTEKLLSQKLERGGGGGQTDRETGRDRERQRDRDRQTETDRHTGKQTDRDREAKAMTNAFTIAVSRQEELQHIS